MNKKKIELQVLNISSSRAQAGAYAMVLGEINGERQMPVIIGANEAQIILIEMRGINPPRPLTHNLLASILEVFGTKLMRVLIYRVDNGVFYSYIYLKQDETVLRIDARTSDAIVLALRMGAPIQVYEEILEKERIRPEHLGGEAKNSACGESKLESLKADLKHAVEKEEYERAAKLRDQINQWKES